MLDQLGNAKGRRHRPQKKPQIDQQAWPYRYKHVVQKEDVEVNPREK